MDANNQKTRQYLESLRTELAKSSFNDERISKELAALKVIARRPSHGSEVYSEEGFGVLARCAFSEESQSRPLSALEAARIVANAILLHDRLQQTFVNLGYNKVVVDMYAKESFDHEFVGGRLLFLLTYRSNLDYVSLIEAHDLVSHINSHLDMHAKVAVKDGPSDMMQGMALLETLKLLYNLASEYPEQMHFFSKALGPVVSIFDATSIPANPLDPPISQLLNVLAVVDWSAATWTKDGGLVESLAERLIHFLDRCTSSTAKAELETQLISLVTVIRKTNALDLASVKQLFRAGLLPQDIERDKPLGHSTTLASRLLKLQTAGGSTVLPDAISSLLFDLSDNDATTFVRNIGYGHAAGYLMTHKIAVPGGLAGAKRAETDGEAINPVTGQRLTAEPAVDIPPLTEEEKAKEAERLYVLFERLRATGVVQAENPLRTAQESGRFEELSDSEPD